MTVLPKNVNSTNCAKRLRTTSGASARLSSDLEESARHACRKVRGSGDPRCASLEKSGFAAQVQAGSKDDGIDIIAVRHEDVLEDLVLLVQCKQVASNVGVRVVRELYGMTNQRNASMGVLVTTASFTQPAHAFQRPVSARLSLRGYEKLKKWLNRVTA